MDLLIKCTEAIVTKKIKKQDLKASPFSIHVEEILNGLDKHRRTFAEKRVCDVLFDVEMSNEIENSRYAVNGPHFLPGTPNNAAQNFQNQYYNVACNSGSTGPLLSMLQNYEDETFVLFC